MGDNIPGKFREQLNFAGGEHKPHARDVCEPTLTSKILGFPLYRQLTRDVLDRGFEGFVTA
jgi:hypothetical protein